MKKVIYYLGAALIVAFMTLQLHADEPASPILFKAQDDNNNFGALRVGTAF